MDYLLVHLLNLGYPKKEGLYVIKSRFCRDSFLRTYSFMIFLFAAGAQVISIRIYFKEVFGSSIGAVNDITTNFISAYFYFF